jgi:site-specific DNA-methyltransferase (adenine-specific)
MAWRVECGDWLALAAGLEPSSVDFVYLDPPFCTGREHRTPPGAGKRAAWLAEGEEKRAGLEAGALSADGRTGWKPVPREEGSTDAKPVPLDAAFLDVFESTTAYVLWLRERLAATRRAMKASAVVAVHCDFRVSHHVRLLMDELYTPHCFVNHLIWHYGLGGSSPRRFARKHDDIIVYCVDPALYYFEAPMVAATSQKMKGRMKKATDVVRVELDSLLEIPSLNNMARERTGYPTQKPLALLELLVGAFCPVGGTVLDPTCGSGTTLMAAKKLGRDAIGFDRSESAVEVARGRLAGT